MKALVVSADERARAWVRGALGPAWTVRDAADGIEALGMARAALQAALRAREAIETAKPVTVSGEPFDLVIAWEQAEPYGAFGLCRDLKHLEEPPAVIVLLDRPHDAWLARWSRADRWLVQPVAPFELAAAARELAGTTTKRAG